MNRLFKYRMADDATFERDICALLDEYFWSSTRDDLNDPFEGVFKKEILNFQMEQLKKISLNIFASNNHHAVLSSFENFQSSINKILDFVDKLGIFSLSTLSDDKLLWAHYGNSHKGFCIEYNSEELGKFDKDIYCINIEYKNTPPHFNLNDFLSIIKNQNTIEKVLQKILGTKSKSWSYEREVRLVTTQSGKQQHDFRAVKAIYFGSRMDEEKQDKLMQTLAGRNIAYFKIEMSKNSYKLVSTPINDFYKNAPCYRYSIGEIEDFAIYTDDLKPELKKYEHYLYKAAEIVRREPYCNKIIYVNFSVNKGSTTAPIVIVQYYPYPNKNFNHYLTLTEIDKQFSIIKDL